MYVPFRLFLRYFYWILEMFRKFGIYYITYFLYFCFYINVQTRREKQLCYAYYELLHVVQNAYDMQINACNQKDIAYLIFI
jgi:hypothetical protein